MILDKEIEITIGTRNKKYYSDLGYFVTGVCQKIVVKTEHLQNGCADQVSCKCDVCGFEKEIRYNTYIKNTKNLTEPYCCCNKCAVEKYKKSILKIYGVESQFQLEKTKEKCKIASTKARNERTEEENKKILEKTKQTNLKNYGVENVFQNEGIKEKSRQTMMERYNVEYTQQSSELKEKVKQAMLTKHGVEYAQQNKEIQEKSKQTCYEHYGVEHAQQNKKIQEKTKQTCLERYGVKYPMQNQEILKRQQMSAYKLKQYKNTNLFYQGSYELSFLESIDDINLLHLVSKGDSYEYILDDKFHVYHSDFIFNGDIIEIKSTWTYNKNGTDLELELKNETKWTAVRAKGDKITILFSKEEIKNYVENLKQTIY